MPQQQQVASFQAQARVLVHRLPQLAPPLLLLRPPRTLGRSFLLLRLPVHRLASILRCSCWCLVAVS